MDRNNSSNRYESDVFPPSKSRMPVIRAGMLLADERKSKTDVLGSYTGVPTMDEVPTQDADDL